LPEPRIGTVAHFHVSPRLIFCNVLSKCGGDDIGSDMIERLQEHAANERTYLSWIRTSIAIAGFGILIERLPGTPNNTWVGVSLVVLSAILVFLTSLRFLVIRKQINEDRIDRASFAWIEVIFAAMLALLLLTVFVFLLGLVRTG